MADIVWGGDPVVAATSFCQFEKIAGAVSMAATQNVIPPEAAAACLRGSCGR
jgi:hypothetical protein